MIEARYTQSNARLQTAVDNFARNAPAGSEAAVTVLKSAVASAGAAYDAMRKATAQATAMAQACQSTANAPASGPAKSSGNARVS